MKNLIIICLIAFILFKLIGKNNIKEYYYATISCPNYKERGCIKHNNDCVWRNNICDYLPP
jgi:hypothetical protein